MPHYLALLSEYPADFLGSWYQVWVEDRYHAVSYPEYLAALARHDGPTRDESYQVWVNDSHGSSYPAFLDSLPQSSS